MVETLFDEEEKHFGLALNHFSEEEGNQIAARVIKATSLSDLRWQVPWIVKAMERWDGRTNVAIWLLKLPPFVRTAHEKQWRLEHEANNVKLLQSLTQAKDTYQPVSVACCPLCCCSSSSCVIL